MSLRITAGGLLRISFRNVLSSNAARLRCNFKCSYCAARYQKQVAFSSSHVRQVERIAGILEGLDDRLIIRINFGGETTKDARALECARVLGGIKNIKTLEFVTNNSAPPREYLPAMGSSVSLNCSFHPECIDFEKFLEHCLQAKGYGSKVIVNMPVAPQFIYMLEGVSRRLSELDIPFKPILLVGQYQGKMYPGGFTRTESEAIRKFYYSDEEFEWMSGKATDGEECRAGVDFMNLHMDGEAHRCFDGPLGNIEDLAVGKAVLHTEPYPCPIRTCQCAGHCIFLKSFRRKYSLDDGFIDHYRWRNRDDRQGMVGRA